MLGRQGRTSGWALHLDRLRLRPLAFGLSPGGGGPTVGSQQEKAGLGTDRQVTGRAVLDAASGQVALLLLLTLAEGLAVSIGGLASGHSEVGAERSAAQGRFFGQPAESRINKLTETTNTGGRL